MMNDEGIDTEVTSTFSELEKELTTATIQLYLQKEGLLPKQPIPLETFREKIDGLKSSGQIDPFFGADSLKDIDTRYSNLERATPDIKNEFQEILDDLQGLREKYFGKSTEKNRWSLLYGMLAKRRQSNAKSSNRLSGVFKIAGNQRDIAKKKDEHLKNTVLYCLNKDTLDQLFKQLGIKHNPKHFFQIRDVWTTALAEPFDNPRLRDSDLTNDDIRDTIKSIKAIPDEHLDTRNANRCIEMLGQELQARGVTLKTEHLPDIPLSQTEIDAMANRMGSLPSKCVGELVGDLSKQDAERFVSNFQNLLVALKDTVGPKYQKQIMGDHLLHFDELNSLATSVIIDPVEKHNFLTIIDKWVKKSVESTLHASLEGYRKHETVLWKLHPIETDQAVVHDTPLERYQIPTHQISRASTFPLNVSNRFPSIRYDQSQATARAVSKNRRSYMRMFRKIPFVERLIKRFKTQHPPSHNLPSVEPTHQPEHVAPPTPKEALDLSALPLAHQFGLTESTELMKTAIKEAGYQAPGFGYIGGSHRLQKGWKASIRHQDNGRTTELTTEVGFNVAIKVMEGMPKDSPPSHDQIGEFLTTLSLYQGKLGLNLSTAIQAAPITKVTPEDKVIIEKLTGNKELKPRQVRPGDSLGGGHNECPIFHMKEVVSKTDNPTFWFYKKAPKETSDARVKKTDQIKDEIIAMTADQIKTARTAMDLPRYIERYREKQEKESPANVVVTVMNPFKYEGPQKVQKSASSSSQTVERKSSPKPPSH